MKFYCNSIDIGFKQCNDTSTDQNEEVHDEWSYTAPAEAAEDQRQLTAAESVTA